MKTSKLLTAITILFQIILPNAYGSKIIIDRDTVPYASGSVSTYVHNYMPGHLDTVLFHGFGFRFFCKLNVTPESQARNWEISFDTTKASILGVSNSANWDTLRNIYGQITTISSDTVWEKASLLPLDFRRDILLGSYLEIADSLHSLLLIQDGTDFSTCTFNLNIFPNSTVIIYLHSKIGYNCKCQFAGITTQVDTTNCVPFPTHKAPDSLYIRWAVDSAGNGKFVTPVHTAPAHSVPVVSRTVGFDSKLVLTNKSDGLLVRRELRMYDIRGRVMRERIIPAFR